MREQNYTKMSRRYMTLSIMCIPCCTFWYVLCRRMLYTE